MIGFFSSQPHYWHHLAPVYHSLPERLRGPVRATGRSLAAARSHGLPAAAGVPEGERILVAGGHDAGLLQGRHRVAHLDHGAGQTYNGDADHPVQSRSYPGGPDLERVELWLTASERVAALWRGAYPHSTAVAVGPTSVTPETIRQPKTGIVAVTWHWSCDLVAEAGTAYHDWVDYLPALANRVRLIGHAHPRWPRSIRKAYVLLGIEPVEDWREVVRLADVLVADNSSVMYEWAAMGRPVIALNSMRWRTTVDHGLRFWEAIPGPSLWPDADGPGDLLEHAAAAAWDAEHWNWRHVGDHAVEIAYGNLADGFAAYRAAEVLIEWATA
jgi:hypothetical protein